MIGRFDEFGGLWKVNTYPAGSNCLVDTISTLAVPCPRQGSAPRCTALLAGSRPIRAFASNSSTHAPRFLELWSDAPSVSHVRTWESSIFEPQDRIEEFEVVMNEFSILIESFSDKRLCPYPRATLCLPAELCNDFCLLLAAKDAANFEQLNESFVEKLNCVAADRPLVKLGDSTAYTLH